MQTKEMWEAYNKINPHSKKVNCALWKFAKNASSTALAIYHNKRVASATPYALYGLNKEVPVAGEFAIVINDENEAVCIVKLENVYILPFYKISDAFAKRSGYEDLQKWKIEQIPHFKHCMEALGADFNEGIELLCIEFRKVYPNES